MSVLPDILTAQEKSIRRALAEQLPHLECPALVSSRAGEPASIVEALRACCAENDEAAPRLWAAAAVDAEGSLPVPYAEVLASLHCVERVVRYYVVKEVAQKKALVPALAELSIVVERLRRACFEALPAESSGIDPSDYPFAALTDACPDFICLATSHGEPFYLNRAGRRMVGLDENAPTLPKSLQEYYGEESWKQLRDVAVPVVNKTGHWEGQSQLRNRQTGEPVDVETAMFFARSSEGEGGFCLAVVHREVNEWVRVAKALAETEARKRAILESSLDPIITINHEGVITEFNRAAEQAFGHPRSKVLGTQPSEVLFPPEKSAGERNRIGRYLDAGEGSMLGKRTEVTAVRANGETFPAEMTMTITQEQGAPVLTFFVRDISQRKKAEREQARYAAELERSNRELEQFAYIASHDLQEPLRKIRTFSDRLEMRCGDALDEKGHECIDRMQNAAARMQLLIEGLLTLSQVTTRGQNFEPVDLSEVAREVVSDLETQIERVEGRVEVGRLPTIQADRLQIRQLMQNLIGNALKFCRADEPPVVKVEGQFVHGRTRREAGRKAADEKCRITVADNGIGLDEKYVDRIFDVFQRLHPRDLYEGTGVGLAICRKIVQRHGGTISVRSKPNHGSVFEIVLPAVHSRKRKTDR